jgi:hypothetical protein
MGWLSAICEPVISDVYEGKLHARIAAGLAPLMQLQLRVVKRQEMSGALPDWNGSSKSSWMRMGRIGTSSVTRRWGSEGVEPYGHENGSIIGNHGLPLLERYRWVGSTT